MSNHHTGDRLVNLRDLELKEKKFYRIITYGVL